MKPQTIVMSAFGSYAGKTEISFSHMDHGIFLVTGDTGAGKTTIFDAIVYALYGQTSGGRRDGNMMRSQYASPDVPTYVDFTFSYKGQTYQIRRNPEYERESKRRASDGSVRYTTEKAGVSLILPNGTQFQGKMKDVNQKIEDIIGLDLNQFLQIGMIAQGDFLKLLLADSKERKVIFSKIFNTTLYWKIQENLRQKEKKLAGDLEFHQQNCNREYAAFTTFSEEDKEQWEDFVNKKETKKEEILSFIEDQIVQTKKAEKAAMDTLLVLEEELKNRQQALGMGESQKKILDELKHLEQYKETLLEKQPYVKEKKKAVKRLREAKEIRQDEIQYQSAKERKNSLKDEIKKTKQSIEETNVLLAKEKQNYDTLKEQLEKLVPTWNIEEEQWSSQLPLYEEKTRKTKQWKDKQKEEETLLEKQLEESQKENKIKKELKESLETIEENKNVEAEIFRNNNKLNEIETILQTTAYYEEHFGKLCQWKLSMKEAAKQWEEAQKEYRDANAIYEHCYKAFLAEQAGILAQSLVEGEACPVCGSKEHPIPCRISKEGISEADLNLKKEEAEQKEKQRQEKQENFLEQKRKIATEEELLKEDEDFYEAYTSQEDFSAYLTQKKKNNMQIKKLILDLQRELQNNKILLLESQEKEKELRKEEEILRKEQNKTAEQLHQIQVEKQQIESELEAKYKDLVFENVNQAKNAIAKLQKKREELQQKYKKQEAGYEAQEQHLLTQQGKEKSLMEQLNSQQKNVQQEKEKLDSSMKKRHFDQKEYETYMQYDGKEKEWEEQIQAIENNWQICIGKMEALEEQKKKFKDHYDVEQITKTIKEKEVQKEKLQREKEQIYSIYTQNKKIQKALQKEYAVLEKLEEEWNMVSHLSRLANGSLKGSKKIDFETYVQRQFFHHIIARANLRLIKMSGGQFILQSKDVKNLKNQGAAGLDLDVKSLVTNSVRDVKTLSGGESFMAALSMALGLSDVIQNSTGAIRLDTMFIDEGFGSLDDETRQQAIAILNELAGEHCLIGIISHVTELKEQIENKLIVSKTKKGSSIAWMDECSL